MANFSETLKGILNESVKAVNTAAKNVASATRFKMSEMDNVSRRREAIGELGEKVYGLFEAGMDLPEEVLPLLNEIRALDETLDSLRSDRAEQKAAAAEAAAVEKAARAQIRAEAKVAARAAKSAPAEPVALSEDAPVMEVEAEEETPLTYTGEAPQLNVEDAAEEDK